MSNRQDQVGGGKENLRKRCAGKITAAYKGAGSNGEMSFGQAIPSLDGCSVIPATSWTKAAQAPAKPIFPSASKLV